MTTKDNVTIKLEEELAQKLIPHIANRIRETLLSDLIPPDMLANGRRPGRPPKATLAPSAPPKKRHLSALAKRRIAKAQRARWALFHEKQEREAKRVKGSPKYEAQRATVAARKRKG